MRIAISNIAWDREEDDQIASCLSDFAVDAIDIAPGKYFPDSIKADGAEIARVRTWWSTRGISVTGMQALLFGTQGLNLFGTSAVQTRMLNHLDAVCRIAAGLGASRLVFGSPKNRDRGSVSAEDVDEIAMSFFQKLGDRARSWGVQICLEPNPARYGANYLLNTSETARLVRRIGHDAIKLQLDTGSLTINAEDPSLIIAENADIIGHVHASEPDLAPLGAGSTQHAAVASALARMSPSLVVSVEMLATKNEPHIPAVRRALGVAVHWYRDNLPRSI